MPKKPRKPKPQPAPIPEPTPAPEPTPTPPAPPAPPAPEILEAPRGLEVVYKLAANGLGNGAFLTWTNPAYGPDAHLLVERSWEGEAAGWHIIATGAHGGAPLFGPATVSHHDSGTWNGQWYFRDAWYRVRAYNGTQWSAYSNVVQHTRENLSVYTPWPSIALPPYVAPTAAPKLVVVACEAGRIVTLDLTDPAHPGILSANADPSPVLQGAYHVAVVGQIVYATAYSGAFVSRLLTDPALGPHIQDPRLLGAAGFRIRGDFADICCQRSTNGNGALVIVHLPTMTIVSVTAREPYTQTGLDLDLFGDYALVQPNGWHQGHSVWNVADPASRSLAGWLMENYVGGGAMSSCIRGNLAYVTQDNGNLAVLRLDRPKRPDYIGFLPIPNSWGIDVDGDRCYCVSEEGFYVIDTSDPTSPVHLGHGAGMWKRVKARNRRLYLTRDGGFDIFDCSTLPPTGIGTLTDTLLAGAKGLDLI